MARGGGRSRGFVRGGQKPQQRRLDYAVIEKVNPLFEEYYKSQQIIPAEEWEDFMRVLRAPLPMTFRFTGSRSHALELKDSMKTEFFSHMENVVVEGEAVERPEPLPWYADELGWKFNLSKNALRKSEDLARFHKFLVAETEIGNVSRQEAVSMIPPMLLDVQPDKWVLDMCAAPGSKTAQLIEAVHDDPSRIPTGLVVANDSNYKRAYMLAHQVRRLQSPAMLVCNHDATCFPALLRVDEGKSDPVPAQFDRVLCDVPCSGDGTMRKNPAIWIEWAPSGGLGLHPTQLKILVRGAQLLKVGGRLVYSTCSMNPVENEAVVAEALRRAAGALRLVDVSDQLIELKRRPGLASWKVMLKDQKFYEKYEDITDDISIRPPRSVFPPAETTDLHLERCLRIYPHLQDSGGFFVAVFEKVGPMTKTDRIGCEADITKKRDRSPIAKVDAERAKRILVAEEGRDCPQTPKPECAENSEAEGACEGPLKEPSGSSGPTVARIKKKPRHPSTGPQELPFFIVDPNNPEIAAASHFYGLSPDFPRGQFVTRTSEQSKVFSFISTGVRAVLRANPDERLKAVVAGVRVFVRQSNSSITKAAATLTENDEPICPLRFSSSGVALILPFLSGKRRATASVDDLCIMLKTEFPLIRSLSEGLQKTLGKLGPGCIIVEFNPQTSPGRTRLQASVIFPAWKSTASLNMLVNKEEKCSLCQKIIGFEQESQQGNTDAGDSMDITPAGDDT